MRVNFRSLRDSDITWEALAGTPVDRIQSRPGHEHISTTLGYVKAVEDLKGKFGTPFAPLPFGKDLIGQVKGWAPETEQFRAVTSSGCWTRTSDPAVNSRLLYQLS